MTAPNFQSYWLGSEHQRRAAANACMLATHGHVASIRPATRTLAQNARLHAMLTDIAKSGFEHEGRKFDVDDLKTLFVSAWMIETGRRSDVVRGFSGEAVQLRRSTTTFSKEELGELMDLVEAFAAQRNIKLKAVE